MRPGYKDGRASDGEGLEPIVRKLSTLAPLEAEDLNLLHSLRGPERFGAGRTVRPAGEARPRLRFLTSGWAARQKLLSDGRRQILSVILPGDLMGLADTDSGWSGTSIVALTPVETVDAAPLFIPGRASVALQAALSTAEALEQWLMLEQVMRLGRRAALERAAHFLLELEFRLGLAGQGDRGRFALPVTQEVLSDVLGLSIVHVNRTFLQLRRERWIELRSRVVELLRRDQLSAAADFQPPPFLAREARTPAAPEARAGLAVY